MGRNDAEVLEQQVDLILWLERAHASFAELADTVKAAVTNNVLFSGLVKIPAAGVVVKDFPISFASATIHNHSGDTLTVVAGEPQQSAPAVGEGVFLVEPGNETINVAGHVLTIYGTPGDLVGVQIFSRPQPASGAFTSLTFSQNATSAGPVTVAQNPASVVLAAANGSRKGGVIWNDTAANLFVTYGAVSAVNLFTVKIGPGLGADIGPAPIYNGVISGIWDAAGGGNAMVTELV